MMKSIYDIQQFLKKFGTLIYIGDRISTLQLMEEEVRELYNVQLMDPQDFRMAIFLIRQEIRLIEEEKATKQ